LPLRPASQLGSRTIPGACIEIESPPMRTYRLPAATPNDCDLGLEQSLRSLHVETGFRKRRPQRHFFDHDPAIHTDSTSTKVPFAKRRRKEDYHRRSTSR
jgi:hypothetical protein